MLFTKKARAFVKRVVVSMWETVVEDFTKLPKIAAKSLIICPAFMSFADWFLIMRHHMIGGLASFWGRLSSPAPPKRQIAARTKKNRNSHLPLSCLPLLDMEVVTLVFDR